MIFETYLKLRETIKRTDILYLKSLFMSDYKQESLNETINTANVKKAIEIIKEYRGNSLLIVYGENEHILEYFKLYKNATINKKDDYYEYIYDDMERVDLSLFVTKNNKLLYIQGDFEPIIYLDYHNKIELKKSFSNNYFEIENYLIIDKIKDINYSEYILSLLLSLFNENEIDKVLSNYGKTLINDIILFFRDNFETYEIITMTLKKIMRESTFNELVNYNLKTINHIFNHNIYPNIIKSNLAPKEYDNDFKFVLKSITTKPFENLKDNQIEIKETFKRFNKLFSKNHHLIILNNTLENQKIVTLLKEKYLSYKEYSDYLIFEVDSTFNYDELNKNINDYEIYTIVGLENITIMINDYLVDKNHRFDLSRLYYLANYFGFKLDEFIMCYFIYGLDKKYNELLIENINTPLMRQIFYKLKTERMDDYFKKRLLEMLEDETIDFSKRYLGDLQWF